MAIVTITTENDADFIRGFICQKASDNSPINLTGYTLRMGVRLHAEDAIVNLLLTTENGGLTIVDAPNGKFVVAIKSAQLQNLGIGVFAHSLIRIAADGTRFRLWSGTLTNAAGPSR